MKNHIMLVGQGNGLEYDDYEWTIEAAFLVEDDNSPKTLRAQYEKWSKIQKNQIVMDSRKTKKGLKRICRPMLSYAEWLEKHPKVRKVTFAEVNGETLLVERLTEKK